MLESFQVKVLRPNIAIGKLTTQNSTVLCTPQKENITRSIDIQKSTTTNSPYEHVKNASQRHFTTERAGKHRPIKLRTLTKKPPP